MSYVFWTCEKLIFMMCNTRENTNEMYANYAQIENRKPGIFEYKYMHEYKYHVLNINISHFSSCFGALYHLKPLFQFVYEMLHKTLTSKMNASIQICLHFIAIVCILNVLYRHYNYHFACGSWMFCCCCCIWNTCHYDSLCPFYKTFFKLFFRYVTHTHAHIRTYIHTNTHIVF